MTKDSLLQNINPRDTIDLIAKHFPSILDEEIQESCLEEVYDVIAINTPQPENFALLTNDQKAQHEIDVDMLLITIDCKDIGKYVFKEEIDKVYFWTKVPKSEKIEAIFQKIF